MIRTIQLTLLCALACFSLSTATALAADSISVTVGADPTEEVPLPITLSWSSSQTGAYTYVTVKPAGGQGCATSHTADDPNSTDVVDVYDSDQSTGTSKNWTFPEPGQSILCAYLQKNYSDTTPLAVAGPITVTVRQAKAAISVVAPARVDAGSTFSLSLPGNAELQRYVWLTSKPAGGRGCAATYALDDPQSTDVISGSSLQGTQTIQKNVTADSVTGTYLLCAYVQESYSDTNPEATASTTFLVGPDPCGSAQAALTKAQNAVQVQERSVNNNRRSWQNLKAKARRSHGAARRYYQAYARRAHSRYQSAVRRRAKARATLSIRQNAATQACG
jgi:hypothetical protein